MWILIIGWAAAEAFALGVLVASLRGPVEREAIEWDDEPDPASASFDDVADYIVERIELSKRQRQMDGIAVRIAGAPQPDVADAMQESVARIWRDVREALEAAG